MGDKKIKFDLKESLNLFKFKFKKSLWTYLFRKSGTIVMTLFVLISAISGFLIYKYLYSAGWSAEQKSNYLREAKKNEVEFDLKRFEKVIQKIEERNKNYEKGNFIKVEDIFGAP